MYLKANQDVLLNGTNRSEARTVRVTAHDLKKTESL